MKLSIVTSLYCSALYLREFYSRMRASAQKITDDFEIILVNDGSPDDSLAVALSLYEQDEHVKIIDLSRNFGHHRAFMTGVEHAQGEYIFFIDCDLEEDPELLELFYNAIRESQDVDVVYGVQEARKGGWLEKITGALFFGILANLSNVAIPRNLITMRILKKRFAENLLKHRERELFLAGIFALTGFNQKPLVVKKHHRGKSTYTLRKKLDLAINSFVSFSSKPLEYIFYLGLFTTFFSILYIVLIIGKKIFLGIGVEGWTSLIASIWLLGGMVLFSIGIVGIYLAKVFTEVKARPLTIVKNVYCKHMDNHR